uniref:C-type lectin domain-containing protein n=1 Tax=Xiphophorus maculatus TaxID=8083 RepID=A0A3B5R8J4_XIPMA
MLLIFSLGLALVAVSPSNGNEQQLSRILVQLQLDLLEEQNYVNSVIKSFDPTQAFTWIGLSDLHKEGSWMRSDGVQKAREHCGHINMHPHYKWNDNVCSETLSFVCGMRRVCQ